MPPKRTKPYEGPADLGKHANHLKCFHLQDREVTVEIEHVQWERFQSRDADSESRKMLVVYFKGKELGLGLGANCNIDSMKRLCGKTCQGWVGKKVTLYPTTCNAFGDPNTPCIRIKATR